MTPLGGIPVQLLTNTFQENGAELISLLSFKNQFQALPQRSHRLWQKDLEDAIFSDTSTCKAFMGYYSIVAL